jgi:short-subunit dehydrogenase
MTPHSIYCAAKLGVSGWSEALYYELRPFGIGVTLVHPGRVTTHFFDHDTFRQRTPRPESNLGTPVEKVSADILRGIERRAFTVYTPKWQGLMVWAYGAVPFLLKPFFGYVIGQRIRGYYAFRGEKVK